MKKVREVVGPILFVIGVLVLQLPLFLTISKIFQRRGSGQENILISDAARAGQVLLLSSLNKTRPVLNVEIRSSPVSSTCSQGADYPTATADAASAPAETKDRSEDAAFKPLSFANHPFILFSVYRDTLNTFYVLGTTSVIVRKFENEQPVYRCEWDPKNETHIRSDGAQQLTFEDDQQEAPLVTEASLLYVEMDENGMLYVPAIVNCTFNQSVGANGEGGLLRLHLSRGPSFWGPHYAIEDVFREKPGEVSESSKSRLQKQTSKSESTTLLERELRNKYAFCGPPLYGTAHNLDWIPKWLAYHHYLWAGKAHFYFYLAEDLNTEARQMLTPWIKAGLLTVIEAGGGEAYPSWYRNQVLFINDCIYRTRFTAQWTFFHDLDELLYVPAPNTLSGLLDEYRNKPWMTFGNLPFSTDHCATSTSIHDADKQQQQQHGRELWQLERMLWRRKLPECMHEDEDPWMCIAAPGRRKYVVNPRKVFVSGVHRVAIPEDGGGVNLNASVARIHHFHGITNPQMEACGHLVNVSLDAEQPDAGSLEFDDAMASLMPDVRKFAGPLLLPP